MLGKGLPVKKSEDVNKRRSDAIDKSSTCEIAFLLDRSGSMRAYAKEAIEGFNGFIDSQKRQPGYADLTLCLFDDDTEILMDGVNLNNARYLDRGNYRLRGWTALLDAVGYTMSQMMVRHSESGHPARVIVVILTDGEENSSREYSHSVVKSMVERVKAIYGWEFIVIGVGVNAESIASDLGIDKCCALPEAGTPDGMRRAFQASTQSVAHFRKTGTVKLLGK